MNLVVNYKMSTSSLINNLIVLCERDVMKLIIHIYSTNWNSLKNKIREDLINFHNIFVVPYTSLMIHRNVSWLGDIFLTMTGTCLLRALYNTCNNERRLEYKIHRMNMQFFLNLCTIDNPEILAFYMFLYRLIN